VDRGAEEERSLRGRAGDGGVRGPVSRDEEDGPGQRGGVSRAVGRGRAIGIKAFVQYEGSDVVDAAVLLMPLVKFISPTGPTWLSTLDALTASLVSDSLVYRYNPRASPDGVRGAEGTFSACSFWYVEALADAGRLDEARLAFEKDAHPRQPRRPVCRADQPRRTAARELPRR
jgi:GH15 family glucan-1,4-alpha-glucosidase